MSCRSLLTLTLVSWIGIALTGCSTFPPPPPQSYPHTLFSRRSSDSLSQVEDVLKWGDEYRNSAHACFSRGEWNNAYWYGEEAKKYYKYVLDNMEPNNAYAAVNMGYIPLMLARGARSSMIRELMCGQAIAMFKQADENRKGYADAHKYMGELYAMQKQWQQAEEEFSRLVDAGIENAYIHAWWAYVLSAQGDVTGANLHIRKAVDCAYPEPSATWARRKL